MKIIKISKSLCGAVACAAALFIGAAPMTAFAQTGPEAECICETKCTEDEINPDCPVCSKDYTLCQGAEPVDEGCIENEPEEEPDNDGIAGPLTPDGNMTIVDDYGTLKAGGKQFITLVSKSGNYFYLIIDRDDQGEETVHFLNMVDESDLLALMDDEEQEAYFKSQGYSSEEEESTEKEVIESEPEEEPVEVEPEKKTGVSPAAIIALVIFLGAGGFMGYKYLKEKGSKKEAARPDPDEDYSEDEEEDYLDQKIDDSEVTEEEDALAEDSSEEE